ncbi:hypothetical protein U1Q18_022591, partial [Sarracenia purpurea var. burkii]
EAYTKYPIQSGSRATNVHRFGKWKHENEKDSQCLRIRIWIDRSRSAFGEVFWGLSETKTGLGRSCERGRMEKEETQKSRTGPTAEEFAGSGCVPTGEERWSEGGAVVAENGGAGLPVLEGRRRGQIRREFVS